MYLILEVDETTCQTFVQKSLIENMLKTMHGGLLEVEGQTYQIFVEKICLKYVENYDCLEVDELTFWNIIFLKSFCWKYVENYACSLT